jgi:hypothetical protein
VDHQYRRLLGRTGIESAKPKGSPRDRRHSDLPRVVAAERFRVANPKQFANPNEIAGFGPLLRWNFVEVGRLRLFADAGADFIQTGSPAYVIPLAGVGYNFFLRAGSGASLRLHSAYWLDASFRWGYITSGFGPGGNNYTPWNGLGAALALRHTFPR